MYTPLESYEERITPDLIKKVQAELRRIREETGEEKESIIVTPINFNLDFPYVASNVPLETVEIPDEFGLTNTVKKL